jgi:hypothetical protein
MRSPVGAVLLSLEYLALELKKHPSQASLRRQPEAKASRTTSPSLATTSTLPFVLSLRRSPPSRPSIPRTCSSFVRRFVDSGLAPTLFCGSPPIQIDGNGTHIGRPEHRAFKRHFSFAESHLTKTPITELLTLARRRAPIPSSSVPSTAACLHQESAFHPHCLEMDGIKACSRRSPRHQKPRWDFRRRSKEMDGIKARDRRSPRHQKPRWDFRRHSKALAG